jgi:hypothetical protein
MEESPNLVSFAYLLIGIFTGVRAIASSAQLALFRGKIASVMFDYWKPYCGLVMLDFCNIYITSNSANEFKDFDLTRHCTINSLFYISGFGKSLPAVTFVGM